MRRRVLFLLLLTLVPAVALAEEKETGAARISSAEIVFSERIHSASLELEAAHGKASIGGLYFGSSGFNVGALGIGRTLRLGSSFTLTPAINAAVIGEKPPETHNEYGEGGFNESVPALHRYHSAEPAGSLRWKLHKNIRSLALVSEGSLLFTVLGVKEHRNFYSDGAHISVRLKKLEAGMTPTLIDHYLTAEDKIERERKFGGRIGFRLGHGFGVAGYTLFRGKISLRASLFYAREE